jgi:tetratricopeptide (TPR) repeat protein
LHEITVILTFNFKIIKAIRSLRKLVISSFAAVAAPTFRFRHLLVLCLLIAGSLISYGQPRVPDTALISSYLKKAESGKPGASSFFSSKAAALAGRFLTATSLPAKVKIRLMQQLIRAEINVGLCCYQDVNYKMAMDHYNIAYRWAKVLGQPYYLAECLFNFAEVNLEQSRYTPAMTRYFEALQEYVKAGDQSGIYWCYTGMGIAQKSCGNFADAIICYEKALTIALDASMKTESAYCYNNLGNVYRKQSNYPKAMAAYEKALTIFMDGKESLSVSDCLNNIGNLFMDQGDPVRALDYYDRSVKVAEIQKDSYRLVGRYKNLADAWLSCRNYLKASSFLDKALQLAEKINDSSLLASCYSQAGTIHIQQGSTDIGLPYLQKASQIFGLIGAKADQSEVLLELANTELKTDRTDDAIKNAETVERLSAVIGGLKTLAGARECLAKAWEKKGNPGKSLVYLKSVLQLNDSIFSVEKSRAVEEIEAGFTRTRLENENKILAQNGKLQKQALKIRNTILSSLVTGLILSLVVIWLIIKRNQALKRLARQEKTLKQKEIEKLNEDLLRKERELTTKTVYITQKNSLLMDVIGELEILKKEPVVTDQMVTRLQHQLKKELSPNAWREFEVQFNEVHPGFQERLLNGFPSLTPTERRLCAFLRLNMNTREIASLTGQTFKSIEVARVRIRKKMNIRHEDNLANAVSQI